MNKLKFFVALIANIVLSIAYAQLPLPINDPSWNPTPVFFDDFLGTTLNSTKWSIANNSNHYGEVQCYTNRTDNVSLSNGTAGVGSYVSLKLKKEDYTCTSGCYDLNHNPVSPLTLHYTSGWIDCKYNPLKYGYIEANISVPYDNVNSPQLKYWPAFWTSIWPFTPPPYYSKGEIDIMEQVAGYYTEVGPQDDKMLGSSIFLHYGTTTSCPGQTITWTKQGALPYSYANTFHKYACRWTPYEINWYFDDILVSTYYNPGLIPVTIGGCPDGSDIYNGGGIHNPVKLILNLAYQGNFNPTGNETTLFAEMKVDYVKIYQQRADVGCPTIVSSTNFDFTTPTYDNKVKNYINIGGTGSNLNTNGLIVFPTSPNISIEASQYVELGAGFSTPNNSSIIIDVPGCPK